MNPGNIADSGVDVNLMALKSFKSLFPKSTTETLPSTKNNVVVNIQQSALFEVQFRHKDKVVRCIFLLVLGNSPALLRMLDIRVLGKFKITCEDIKGLQVGRKSDFQT